MPSPIASKPLTLDDFQKFSETANDTTVVGKKFLGSGLKAITSLSAQQALGDTSVIIADFKTALAEKYGAEIADFVFSPESERAALSQGLTKQTITAVLKKAKAITSSNLSTYPIAFCTK